MAQDNFTATGNQNWTTAADWSLGIPTSSEDTFIGTNGAVVDSGSNETVNSIGTGTNGDVLDINAGTFVATDGTGPTANYGTINIADGSTLKVTDGDFANYGTVTLNSTGYVTEFDFTGFVTISGGGSIEFVPSAGSQNYMFGQSPTTTVINDNVIFGTGIIGTMYFTNNGQIDADPGQVMQVWGSSEGGSFDNEGSMFASGGGALVLGETGFSSTIGNDGLIEAVGYSANTSIEIAGDLTIIGGQILLAGPDPNYDQIVSNGSPAVLNLDGGSSISGSGTVGDSNLTINVGPGSIINADNPGGHLRLSTNGNTIANHGVLEATNGGAMDIQSAVNNSGTVATTTGGTLNVGATITGSGSVTVGSGSALNVLRGGGVSALTIKDPNDDTARATIQSGGTVDGNIKIDGGELILDAGAVLQPNTKLTIVQAGKLILHEDSFEGTLKHFGGQDPIDLTKFSFVGATESFTQTSAAGGTLQVVNGSQVVDLHLTGTYTTANFALSPEGHHGTTVTFVP